ncbi:MAG: hypothetical protein NT027_07350 [Proteobacteria bacterium]|nr:hypothetical protein [Pseudomonadota bacterium]
MSQLYSKFFSSFGQLRTRLSKFAFVSAIFSIGVDASACEYGQKTEIIGGKAGRSMVLLTSYQFPDEEPKPEIIRVFDYRKSKMQQSFKVSPSASVESVKNQLIKKGYVFPIKVEWVQLKKVDGKFVGSLGQFESATTGIASDMELKRNVTFVPKDSDKRQSFDNFQNVSKSATEASVIESIWELPKSKMATVIMGNCSQEVVLLKVK